jgi:hypothetical protein
VSFSNPGIMLLHLQQPNDGWPFSQQAKAYRPPGALYSRDCNVVIEDFDHFCYWT